MKRRMSQGHAMRSTAAFFRVTKRISLSYLLASCRPPDGSLGAGPPRRSEVVTFDRTPQRALERCQLAVVASACGRLTQLGVFEPALLTHAPADDLFVSLGQLRHRQHVGVAATLDDVLRDPLELLQQVLGAGQDSGARSERDGAESL